MRVNSLARAILKIYQTGTGGSWDHVVFATRERKELLDKQWRAQLHRYMAGTLTGLGASAPSVGGTGDHVHLLFGMRASQSLVGMNSLAVVR